LEFFVYYFVSLIGTGNFFGAVVVVGGNGATYHPPPESSRPPPFRIKVAFSTSVEF